jgi:hypothetical protein
MNINAYEARSSRRDLRTRGLDAIVRQGSSETPNLEAVVAARS